MRKFLKDYDKLFGKEIEYDIYYSILFYCLYRMKQDKQWNERIELNYREFREKVPNIMAPTCFIVYYIMEDYDPICRNINLLIEDSWWISKYLFLLVQSSLLEEGKTNEARKFYYDCSNRICELSHVYSKCYFKLLMNRDKERIREEIITGFIHEDIIQNGIISSKLFYDSLYSRFTF